MIIGSIPFNHFSRQKISFAFSSRSTIGDTTLNNLPINAAQFNEFRLKLVLIKDYGVRSMISIPGSLSFVMSFAPAKTSAGDARCASQDPLTHDKSHKISTQTRIMSAFFLHRTQLQSSEEKT